MKGRPKPKAKVSVRTTLGWTLLALLLVTMWAVYTTKMFEVIVSGKVKALRLLRLSSACEDDDMTSFVHDVSLMRDNDVVTFTTEERDRIMACNRSADTQRKHGRLKTKMFKPDRWTSHSYLDNRSTVIELGGYLGEDADNLISRYQPKRYIMVEPVYEFYIKLVNRFQHLSNVLIFNFGIGNKSAKTSVKLSMDGTSSFNTINADVNIRLVGARPFFLGIGLGFFDVDLLTMNCEGCEFAVLDFLLDSKLINNIRNVQFQPHKLDRVADSVYRYCEYEERLKRTHQLVFRHPFWWESWSRKYNALPSLFDDIKSNATLMDEILS
ncbi:uncharacterized protein [Argopecten irradians]|uniref:uncharacterized protein n=1 Tax=Argopecten irradians TaxID=31199 RepID=UPI00371E3781